MTKKSVLIALVLAAFVSTGAFAQGPGISLGVGFNAALDAFGGVNASVPLLAVDESMETFKFFASGFAFIDTRFVELSLGIGSGDFNVWLNAIDDNFLLDILVFDVGLTLKWPFELGRVTLFPLFGINYRAVLAANDHPSNNVELEIDEPSDFSSWAFRLGGGLDFSLTERVFLRSDLSFYLSPANRFERDVADLLNAIPLVSASTQAGVGGNFRLALGFRL